MTSPDLSSLGAIGGVSDVTADITADITAIQNRIAALSPARATATGSSTGTSAPAATSGISAASTTSAQSFASQLQSATSGSSAASSATATASPVVSDAERYLGIPYVWGGESSSGMDCSGLVQKTFSDLGVSLPRTAAEQSRVGTAVSSLSQAQPGDLLFFGEPAYHVAIYAGDNKLIESPEPGKTVHITSIYQTPTSIRHVDVPGAAASVSAGPTSVSALTATGISPAVAAYAGQFAAAEAKYHLPSGMLAAVAQQESGGNAAAVSPAGAQGLMQLMPATAAGMGVNALDPAQAIDAAGRILSRNLTHYSGSVPLALAAYNAGVGAVDSYKGIPPYAETQNYVRRITASMAAGG